MVAALTECVVCGGPCQEPFHLPPISEGYPFLPKQVLAAMNATPDEKTPPPAPRRRARRTVETGARTPGENNAHGPDEDRS